MKDNVKERILVKLLAAFVLICIVALTLLTVCVAEVEEGTTRIGDSGDILFYIIVAALVVAVIAICIIFRRSKKFVVKERERAAELSKEIPPAKEIRVYDEEYVNANDSRKRAAESKDGVSSDGEN